MTHQFYQANRLETRLDHRRHRALDLFYTYDDVGNITAIADPRPNATQTFVPDPLDRLETASGPWGTLHWQYDAAGNRLSETQGTATTTYTIHAPTQRLMAATGAVNETFIYDNVDQLTSDLISQYTHAPTGQLKTATGAGVDAT